MSCLSNNVIFKYLCQIGSEGFCHKKTLEGEGLEVKGMSVSAYNPARLYNSDYVV
jgi:hypothetical protein